MAQSTRQCRAAWRGIWCTTRLLPQAPPELIAAIENITSPAALADVAVAYMDVGPEEKQEILETVDLPARMEKVARMLAHILRQNGQRVGLTSTSGVYLNGERILKADASGPRSAGPVEAQLSHGVKSLLAVAEAYPQLKASAAFNDLQSKLTSTEDGLEHRSLAATGPPEGQYAHSDGPAHDEHQAGVPVTEEVEEGLYLGWTDHA